MHYPEIKTNFYEAFSGCSNLFEVELWKSSNRANVLVKIEDVVILIMISLVPRFIKATIFFEVRHWKELMCDVETLWRESAIHCHSAKAFHKSNWFCITKGERVWKSNGRGRQNNFFHTVFYVSTMSNLHENLNYWTSFALPDSVMWTGMIIWGSGWWGTKVISSCRMVLFCFHPVYFHCFIVNTVTSA